MIAVLIVDLLRWSTAIAVFVVVFDSEDYVGTVWGLGREQRRDEVVVRHCWDGGRRKGEKEGERERWVNDVEVGNRWVVIFLWCQIGVYEFATCRFPGISFFLFSSTAIYYKSTLLRKTSILARAHTWGGFLYTIYIYIYVYYSFLGIQIMNLDLSVNI